MWRLKHRFVKTTVKELKGKKMAVVPILRAGLGMVEGMLSMSTAAKVGHIGLYRDPETALPIEYYCKLPADCDKHLSLTRCLPQAVRLRQRLRCLKKRV